MLRGTNLAFASRVEGLGMGTSAPVMYGGVELLEASS